MSEHCDLVELAWRATRPAYNVTFTDRDWTKFRRGTWRATSDCGDDYGEFVLADTLALVGVSWGAAGGDPYVSLVGFCGIHEDPHATEWASLTPNQARAIAAALRKAARDADEGADSQRQARRRVAP